MLFQLFFSFLHHYFSVFAYSTSYTESCSISLSRTDWSQNCDLKNFDSSRGDLKKVNVEYYGYIEGNVKVENKDAQSKNITTNYQAAIKFNKEDGTTTSNVPLKLGYSETFNNFDGTVDYAGTSGRTSPKQSNDSTTSSEYTSGPDFDRFKNNSPVRYIASTSGNMTVTGGSNAAADWDTFAKATIKVTYTYEGKDLAIRKTHSGTNFKPGDSVEFTLTISNEDSADFNGTIYVKDIIPNFLTYQSFSPGSWSCGQGGETVNCSQNQTLTSHNTTQIKLKFQINSNANGTITNRAEVTTAGDGNPSNNVTSDWIIIGSNQTPTVLTVNTPKPAVLGACTQDVYEPSFDSIQITNDTATLKFKPFDTNPSCDKLEVQYGNCIEGFKSKKIFAPSEINDNQVTISNLIANQNYNFRARCLTSCGNGKYTPIQSAITNQENDLCPKIYQDNLQQPQKVSSNQACMEKVSVSKPSVLGTSDLKCPDAPKLTFGSLFWLPYFLAGSIFGLFLAFLYCKIRSKK